MASEKSGIPPESSTDPIIDGSLLKSMANLKIPSIFSTPTMTSFLKPSVPNATPETHPEADFDKHQQEYLAKHADEVFPTETGPFTVAVVSRAYRELSNGNLTERLLSLACQQIPSSEFKAYIAVNNVRVDAIAAEVWDREKESIESKFTRLTELQFRERIIEEFHKRNIVITEDDKTSLYENHKANLQKRAHDYRENQATLAILQSLTSAVNQLQTHGDNEQVIAHALENISSSSKDWLSPGQQEMLLHASRLIMKRRIGIMGVDCSSLPKAFESINHGKATNEACHIAMFQGAKYIDVSDMDEYHGPSALKEILALSNTDDVDVLIRPLNVVTPQHPEELKKPDQIWACLVTYYVRSLAVKAKTYGDMSTDSSGSRIVSAKAFRRHEYPEIGYNEDFAFAGNAKKDPLLQTRYALSSDLRLANRGRDVSWDGSGLGSTSEPFAENVRRTYEVSSKASIKVLISQDDQNQKTLRQANDDHIQGVPDLLMLFQEKKSEFFRENQEQRMRLRKTFLGITRDGHIDPKAILPTLYRVLQDHPDWDAEQLMQEAHLKPRHVAFFEQNPLIIPGILQEIRRIQETSTSATPSNGAIPVENLPATFHAPKSPIIGLVSLTQHIVNSLPELFGPPLDKEPTYNSDAIDTMPWEEVNVMNWMHLFQAERWLKAYVANLRTGGTLSPSAVNSTQYLPHY